MMIEFDTLREGELIQSGNEMFKVSTKYAERLTAEWVWPVQDRTRVHTFTRATFEAGRFNEPSTRMLNQYNDYYDRNRVH